MSDQTDQNAPGDSGSGETPKDSGQFEGKQLAANGDGAREEEEDEGDGGVEFHDEALSMSMTENGGLDGFELKEDGASDEGGEMKKEAEKTDAEKMEIEKTGRVDETKELDEAEKPDETKKPDETEKPGDTKKTEAIEGDLDAGNAPKEPEPIEEAKAMLSKSASDGFDGQFNKSWAAYITDLDSGKASDAYLEKLLAIGEAKLGQQVGPKQQDERTIEFTVKLDRPLGMSISAGSSSSGNESFRAMISKVEAGGQAEAAGIQVEMHVIAMNGESTKGKTLDDVVQMVLKAKTDQLPLIMLLKKL